MVFLMLLEAFTKKPGVLTNDYFLNLLDMNITWKETDKSEQTFAGIDRKTKKTKWKVQELILFLDQIHN